LKLRDGEIDLNGNGESLVEIPKELLIGNA